MFAIFSLAASYTHYYGLATAGIINLVLLIHFIIKIIKAHKKNEKDKINILNLKCFIVSAVIQIALYLPWLLYLLIQFQTVSKGFWIENPSIELWLQIFIFQFTGNLDTIFLKQELAFTFSIILFAYAIGTMIYAIVKQKDNNSNKPGLLAIGIYAVVTICIFIISLKVPILYARYFLNLTGIFIFFMAFFMIKGGKKALTIFICILTVITAIFINYQVTKMNYGPNNSKPLEYVKQDLKQEDLILFGNDATGFVLSMQLPGIANCFYDGDYWNVEPAYQAFGKEMKTIKTLEGLDNYYGRIWVVDSGNYNIYNEMLERYGENINLLKQEHFSIEYHSYQYNITLVEKTSNI